MKRFSLLLLIATLSFAATEALLREYYYSKTYSYYEATEVYWEDQNTLLLYLPHRFLFLDVETRRSPQGHRNHYGLRAIS